MKYFFFILFLSLSTQLASQSADIYCSRAHPPFRGQLTEVDDFRSDTFDIQHTFINLDFTQMQSKFIQGYSRINVKALQNGLSSIRLDFEGLQVDSVFVNGQSSSFSQHVQTLRVDFPNSLSTDDTASLKIYYQGEPIKDESGWGGFYFQGDFAWNLGVGFAADPHSYGRVWFPCFDNFIERSTYEFQITVPDGFRAACNGELISSDTSGMADTFHWMLDQTAPSYLVCVAVARYEVIEWIHNGSVSSFPVMLHARAQDTNKLKSSFQNLDESITAFETAYGPYAWNKVGYSLVPFNAGAMEHVTNITYPIYAANGQLTQESLMSHELAHMWWGDLITCKTDGDMWLNEGWASFSEYLADEFIHGRDRYETHMLEDLRFMLQFGHHFEEFYRPVSGQPHEYVYGDHVYKKGALVAHNLRGYLGDEVFFEAVTAFLNAYAFSPVSSEDFEAFLSQHTGEDLSYFFEDWVFNGGYSVVVLNGFESEAVSGQFELSMDVQQKTKGTNGLHQNIPVYYTAYGEDLQTASGRRVVNGDFSTIKDTIDFEPIWVVLYENNELAQAKTADQLWVKQTGPLITPNAFMDVDVKAFNGDSSLLRIEHVWAAPNHVKDPEKAYQLSDYRFWKVTGIGLEDISMEASLFYDGRVTGGSNGYLDINLLAEGEDSLILLYRKDQADDWIEYEDYEKNMLGNNGDGFGLITISQLIEGEYALANINSEVKGLQDTPEKTYKIYPNPASDQITIELNSTDSHQVEVYDSSGRLVFKTVMNRNRGVIDASRWENGTYVVRVSGENWEKQEQIIISK